MGCRVGVATTTIYYTYYIQWNPSNPDTLGPESTVLIIEMSSFQGLEMYCGLLYWNIWF